MRAAFTALALTLAACAHVPDAKSYGALDAPARAEAWDVPLASAARALGLDYVADPRLADAALAVAEAAARAPQGQALTEASMRRLVRAAGVADADVRAALFDSKGEVPAGLGPWASRQLEPLRDVAQVAGGAAHAGRRLCVLVTARRAEFTTALPRRTAPGREWGLAGRLLSGNGPIELFVASPSGEVRREPLGDGPAFATTMRLDEAGPWRIGLVAHGRAGAFRALEASVDVGRAAPVQPAYAPAQRWTREAFEDQLRASIDRHREERRRSALVHDEALAATARTLAQRMRSERFHAHVAPDGEDERRRAAAAGASLAPLEELFTVARSPDEAFAALTESAAQLAALGDRALERVGVGAAELAASEGEAPAWVAVVHLTRRPTEAEREAAAATVLAAVNAARAAVKWPSLRVDPQLAKVAREEAAAFFREGTAFDDATPKALAKVSASGLAGASFSGRTVRTSSLTDLPAAPPEEARMDHVGVGVAQGARTDGPRGELAVILLFADQEGEPVDHDAGVARALEAVNTVRASRKLKPLARDEALQRRADQLARRYFDGVATEALVEELRRSPEWTPKQAMTQAAGEASIVEEVAAWDNLLDPKAARVGLGLATGTRPGGRKDGLYMFVIVASKR